MILVCLHVFRFHVLWAELLAIQLCSEKPIVRFFIALEGMGMGDLLSVDGNHLRRTMLFRFLMLLIGSLFL